MQLTGKNSSYQADSGAFIVHQSDEIQILMQILHKVESIESRLDALTERSGNGGDMEDK